MASLISSLCCPCFPTSTVSWARSSHSVSTTYSWELLLPTFPPSSSLARPLHLRPFQSLPLKTEADATAHPLLKIFTFFACFWTPPPPGFPPSPWMLLLRVLCWLQFFPQVTSPGLNFHPLLFSSKLCQVWLISRTPLTLNVICVDDSSQVSIS